MDIKSSVNWKTKYLNQIYTFMIFQDISNILIKFGQHGNLYEYCYSIQQGSCQ